MTEDPKLIFTLRAISKRAERAFKNSHNERFYVPPPHHEVVAATSRELTPATNVGDEDNAEGKGGDREDFSDQLRFTFDPKPRNIEQGFVFGSNPKTCDVILGSSKDGISSSHFRITFDSKDRLVLIDSSALGTAVSYRGQARKDKRKNPRDRKRNRPRDKSNDFTWILFPEIENKRVIIGEDIPSFPNAPVIEFSVEVAEPKTESGKKQYTELKDAYLDEMQTAIAFGLNIDSHQTTAGQTESHSPKQRSKQRPIWIDLEEIGSGEFGTVYRAVDVTTGVIYAAKTFLRNGEDHRERWDREVALLRKVSHDHIVKFEDHDAERKWPRLIMEYLPLGNLAEQDRISPITEWETVTLLCQALDALDYLHSQEIVHRDLKPENILVQCREPANFCIKIADFGLARDGSFLQTVCGTRLYAAPEIWENPPYTVKVDIWSLGVIAFRYAHGLPHVPMVNGQFHPKRWYQKLTRPINDRDSPELVDLIRSSMLRMEPHERLSASACLREAAKLREAIIPAQNLELDPGTPTEAMSSSAIMGAFRAAGYGGGQQVAAEEAETQIDFPTLSILKSGWRPEDYPETMTQIWMDSRLRSSDIREYIKSNLQPPGSHRPTPPETRKRSTRPSISSSSPTRRPPKRLAKNARSSNCLQHEQSEPVLDLFGEGWLQDSKCVGSSIAALGQEDPSNWSSSWATKTSESPAFASVLELQITERPSADSERDMSERGEATVGPPAQSKDVQPGGGALRVPQSTTHQNWTSSRPDGPHFTKTSSQITGSPYLRPFRRSEVLERHSIRHCEDDQSSPSPKTVEENQPLESSQESTVESTTQSRDVQEDLDPSLVPHNPSWNVGTLTDTTARANRHEIQEIFNRGKENFEDIGQRHTVGGGFSSPIATNERQPNVQDEVRHGNHPAAIPNQKKKKKQRRPERRFLTVSTIYGAIHLLVDGSNLLVNASNIASIFGYSRILSHKDSPIPVLQLTREVDTRLHGSYCNIESALQYCSVLDTQTEVPQANRQVGHILKEQLQRAIEDPGQIQPFIKPSYRKKEQPRCQRCARLHIICSREIPCQNCAKAIQECVYDARQ